MTRSQFFTAPASKHLKAIQTPLGTRTVYDSVSFCNRCGGCTQSCSIYKLFQQENYSPRGKNQALRLMLEHKLKAPDSTAALSVLAQACTLCGRCTQSCPGQIPTAEHVLEIRRLLKLRVLPRLLQAFLQLRETHPRLFKILFQTGLFLRRLGLLKILRAMHFTALPGLQWLDRADDLLPARTPSIQENLCHINSSTQTPNLIYMPSLEAEFILTDLAQQTIQFLQKQHTLTIWANTTSGIFSYVYGDLRQSRRQLRNLMLRHRRTQHGNLPLVTDSIDVYLFLKNAPQLFSGNRLWQKRAQHFASCVRFVTDFAPEKPSSESSWPTPVQLEHGALWNRQDPAFKRAEQFLYTIFGKNFVECLYSDADMPAFGYGFVADSCMEKIGLEAVRKIARTQTKTVVALSGLAVLELSYFLKRFYPSAQVQHFVQLFR